MVISLGSYDYVTQRSLDRNQETLSFIFAFCRGPPRDALAGLQLYIACLKQLHELPSLLHLIGSGISGIGLLAMHKASFLRRLSGFDVLNGMAVLYLKAGSPTLPEADSVVPDHHWAALGIRAPQADMPDHSFLKSYWGTVTCPARDPPVSSSFSFHAYSGRQLPSLAGPHATAVLFGQGTFAIQWTCECMVSQDGTTHTSTLRLDGFDDLASELAVTAFGDTMGPSADRRFIAYPAPKSIEL